MPLKFTSALFLIIYTPALHFCLPCPVVFAGMRNPSPSNQPPSPFRLNPINGYKLIRHFQSGGLFLLLKYPIMLKFIFSSGFLLSLLVSFAQVQTGKASFYADKFEGTPTASGEKYRHAKLTAAHKTLPFGTRVRVTNIANKESVEVVINDRGPYVENRIIDLSKSAAGKLGFINQGLADIKLEVIDAGDGKTSDPIKTVDHVMVEEKEFYDFEISRLKPKGYGVQIGTYQELVNLMRLSDNLKNSYKKQVTVQVKILKGIKYYGLILGQFPTRMKAEQFRLELQKKFPDAFIIEYNRL
jgi:rare lipoprotein A